MPGGARMREWSTRGAVLGPGVLSAAAAGALVAAASGGRPVLVAVLAPLQLVLILAWLSALDARGRIGALVICVGATAAADALTVSGSNGVRRLAGVIGVTLVVALLHQLVRRNGRPGLTASLAATVGGAVIVVGAATLVALLGGTAGTTAVETALGAAAAALLVGRVIDTMAPRPQLARALSRGWPGFVTGLAAALVVGALIGSARPVLGVGYGVVLAAAVGAVAIGSELGVDLARTTAPAPTTGHAMRGLLPLDVLLPLALAAPVAYVTGRIMLG